MWLETISFTATKILIIVIPIAKMYFVAPIRPEAASYIKPLASCINSLVNQRFYVMTSGLRQYMVAFY